MGGVFSTHCIHVKWVKYFTRKTLRELTTCRPRQKWQNNNKIALKIVFSENANIFIWSSERTMMEFLQVKENLCPIKKAGKLLNIWETNTSIPDEYSDVWSEIQVMKGLQIVTCLPVISCYSPALNLEGICYSETPVQTRPTRCYIPEDDIFHSHYRETLKSYRPIFVRLVFSPQNAVGKTSVIELKK
jgi:hypothetical protein